MITKETARRIFNCHQQIEEIDKLKQEMLEEASVTRKEARSMEKINGIIISGKVYKLVPTRKDQRCADSCALNELCSTKLARRGHQPCLIYDTPDNTHKYGEHHFRYSPELTERLNNPKTK